MSVREKDDPEFFARVQEQNLLRQYDLLTNCIEIGVRKGIEAFDKYTLVVKPRGSNKYCGIWR